MAPKAAATPTAETTKPRKTRTSNYVMVTTVALRMAKPVASGEHATKFDLVAFLDKMAKGNGLIATPRTGKTEGRITVTIDNEQTIKANGVNRGAGLKRDTLAGLKELAAAQGKTPDEIVAEALAAYNK